MPVVGLGNRIPGPIRSFEVLKDDAGIAVLIRRVAPNVKIAPSAADWGSPGALEPFALIGGVIEHQLSDHSQSTGMCRIEESLKIA